MLPIQEGMQDKSETVRVEDGANCTIVVRNAEELMNVTYEVYHDPGSNTNIGADPIVVVKGNNKKNEISTFQILPKCYFRKLREYFDEIENMYDYYSFQNEAMRWLLNDTSPYSNCEHPMFVERYALVALNFAAPMNNTGGCIDSPIGWVGNKSETCKFITCGNETQNNGYSADDVCCKCGGGFKKPEIKNKPLWIESGAQHCLWPFVDCEEGRVVNLQPAGVGLHGSIPSEVGLLKNLTIVDFCKSIFKVMSVAVLPIWIL